MDEALLVAFIGVGGIIVGVILSSVITLIAGRWKEARQKRNIRRVLRWENEYNLTTLKDFWWKVTREPAPEGSSEEVAFEQRLRLATFFLPTWGHMIWQSESPRLSSVLTQEEFAGAYRLHNNLDIFAARRAALQQALDNSTARQLRADYERWRDARQKRTAEDVPHVSYERLFNFNMGTFDCWRDCEVICNSAHPLNNPILENTPGQSVRQRVGRWFGQLPRPTLTWGKSKGIASE